MKFLTEKYNQLKSKLTQINFRQKLSKVNFATAIFALGGLIAVGYFLTSAFTLTDNAYIVRIQTPVSSKIAGSVLEVLVKNGQSVKAGDVLVKLNSDNYRLLFEAADAQYEKGLTSIKALSKKVDLTKHNLQAAKENLEILKNQYRQKNHPSVKGGIPQIELSDLKHKVEVQANITAGFADQLEIDQLEVEMARNNLTALKSARDQAEIVLNDSTIKALIDGQVQNVFLGIGKNVAPGETLFTLVNSGSVYVQANIEETDLEGVKQGDKVKVYPRVYFGSKSFEGVVVSDPFGVTRQISQPFTGNQIIATENKWLLLPQRLPVIIEITNTDPKYPLQNGMSAYVRIRGQ
ncbi:MULTISPECIES: HlyD family secretion protein [Polynucleobacter]|uniref:HlyD family secretion protein n=1 Tax=Polynucleobacter TaxID=44013 RepID=UPI00137279E7|nr:MULTISPECIES: HlyD family secretion protein [Polynucleobacter]MBU3552755.1 HlyD family secretion protein [Polynucleobacter sp. MWH-Post4-6-1]